MTDIEIVCVILQIISLMILISAGIYLLIKIHKSKK